ncbi:MAG: transcription elongation factor GreA [Bacilli bacterium]|nr:transcription elongation factor GreA [Bacilli bacterium]
MEKEKIFLTKEGVEKLQEELKYLKEVVRNEIKEELKEARAQGDLSENAEYDAARNRQAQVEGRIQEIEAMLSNVRIIQDKGGSNRVVKLGSTVRLLDLLRNEEIEYQIVGKVEADPLSGKISNETPVAVAIMGSPVGTRLTVRAAVPYEVEILSIK